MHALLALWSIVLGLAGFGGPQPLLAVDASMTNSAEARPAGVYVSPRTLADASGSDQGRANVAAVLLHELAHVHQQPALEPWIAEGSAEAFSELFDTRVAKRLGANPEHWAYPQETRFVWLILGTAWISQGQFDPQP